MKYNDQFKMDVAIEVIQSKQSVSVIAKQYGIHPSTLYRFMNTNFEKILRTKHYSKNPIYGQDGKIQRKC